MESGLLKFSLMVVARVERVFRPCSVFTVCKYLSRLDTLPAPIDAVSGCFRKGSFASPLTYSGNHFASVLITFPALEMLFITCVAAPGCIRAVGTASATPVLIRDCISLTSFSSTPAACAMSAAPAPGKRINVSTTSKSFSSTPFSSLYNV